MGSKSLSSTVTEARDERVQLESTGGGQFVSPEAVQAQSGLAVKTGNFSTLNQTIRDLTLGLSGDQVKQILDSTYKANQAQQREATQLATGAVQSLAASAGAEPIQWSRWIPWAIAGVVLILVVRQIGARHK